MLAQPLNLHQNHRVQSWFLSVAVNHSHMNALGSPTSKSKLKKARSTKQCRRDQPGGVKNDATIRLFQAIGALLFV
jgi:hypothetical protein